MTAHTTDMPADVDHWSPALLQQLYRQSRENNGGKLIVYGAQSRASSALQQLRSLLCGIHCLSAAHAKTSAPSLYCQRHFAASRSSDSLVLRSRKAAPAATRHAGLFARANSVNTNNRLYPKRILLREVKKFVREQVESQCALGELDHPSYSSPTFKHLNLVNVSHQVLSVKWKGNALWGFIEVRAHRSPALGGAVGHAPV
jgi:Prohead core protein serine protease